MTIRTILAAVDQFPASGDVLARASEIASAHGALLRIVHVVDMEPGQGDPDDPETLTGQAALAAKSRIEDALESLAHSSSPTEIMTIAGSPALALIDFCRAEPPDLIVMRAHQRRLVSEVILGSTSDRVIASAVAPVLIVRRSVERKYQRVLIATDGREGDASALALVASLLPRAALRAVRVVQIPAQLREAMLRSGTNRAELNAHRANLVQRAWVDLTTLAQGAPRRVRISIFQGDAGALLTRAAAIPTLDLIAIGPGRAGLIRRAFIGSVARRLLREAACDVLVCHLPDQENAPS